MRMEAQGAYSDTNYTAEMIKILTKVSKNLLLLASKLLNLDLGKKAPTLMKNYRKHMLSSMNLKNNGLQASYSAMRVFLNSKIVTNLWF